MQDRGVSGQCKTEKEIHLTDATDRRLTTMGSHANCAPMLNGVFCVLAAEPASCQGIGCGSCRGDMWRRGRPCTADKQGAAELHRPTHGANLEGESFQQPFFGLAGVCCVACTSSCLFNVVPVARLEVPTGLKSHTNKQEYFCCYIWHRSGIDAEFLRDIALKGA